MSLSDELIHSALAQSGGVRRALVVGGDSQAVMQSLSSAERLGLLRPLIVGPVEAVRFRAEEAGLARGSYDLVGAEGEAEIARKAIELCAGGEADLVMKGQIHTDNFMRALLNRKAGLRTDRLCTHIFYMLAESFPHPYFISDAALNIAPTGATGEAILQNMVELAHRVCQSRPRIALLSASDVINEKMPSSLEAQRLSQWAREWLSADVYGPLPLDVALNPAAAEIKGLSDKPSAGNANGLVMPSIEAGNILFKSWVHFNNALAAGIVCGARLPIVLTGRADSAESRLAAIALAIINVP